MDEKDRDVLKNALRLSEENNKILQYLRRAERFRRVGFAVKWLVIALFVLGAYYAVGPYLASVKEMYKNLGTGIEQGLKALQQLPKSPR